MRKLNKANLILGMMYIDSKIHQIRNSADAKTTMMYINLMKQQLDMTTDCDREDVNIILEILEDKEALVMELQKIFENDLEPTKEAE